MYLRGRLFGIGEPAGVSECQKLADNVLWVLLPLERAYLRRRAACPRRAAAAAAAAIGGELEPWAALNVDERVEVLPEELAVKIARKMKVAGGKGVDHEEWVYVGVEQAVKGMATVGELLHYRASHVKGIGGHCNTRRHHVSGATRTPISFGETYYKTRFALEKTAPGRSASFSHTRCDHICCFPHDQTKRRLPRLGSDA